MLFGDIKGFSKLTDRQMPAFVEVVLGAMAAALKPFAADIEFRNTWGDGIFLVFADPRAAARCGLALQDAIGAASLAAKGLPGTLALRLGGHYGPVFPATDPILERPNLFGAHVARAARLEPVTPPGELYVTEPFAAALALDPAQAFACDYVGTHPAAKDYGSLPMYVLSRRS
jgi:class 3 adenylate cyclase